MRRTNRNNAICFESLEEALAQSPETYGHIDLLCFGFPCQDLSIANRQAKGISQSRSGLFFQAMRIADIFIPQWLLIENVPRLLSINGGRDFAIVLQRLSESGYGYAWRILDSQYFGVAQRRRRLFIVGYFGNQCPPEILFEPKGSRGNIKKNRKMEPVGLCISTRDGEKQDPGGENIIASVVKSTDYHNQPIGQFGNENNLVCHTIRSNKGDEGSPFKFSNENIIAYTIGTEQRGVAGRIWKQSYIAETYTDGKRAVAGVSDRFHKNRGIVLGNAVTVNVAEWIGKRIMKYEKRNQ